MTKLSVDTIDIQSLYDAIHFTKIIVDATYIQFIWCNPLNPLEFFHMVFWIQSLGSNLSSSIVSGLFIDLSVAMDINAPLLLTNDYNCIGSDVTTRWRSTYSASYLLYVSRPVDSSLLHSFIHLNTFFQFHPLKFLSYPHITCFCLSSHWSYFPVL